MKIRKGRGTQKQIRALVSEKDSTMTTGELIIRNLWHIPAKCSLLTTANGALIDPRDG